MYPEASVLHRQPFSGQGFLQMPETGRSSTFNIAAPQANQGETASEGDALLQTPLPDVSPTVTQNRLAESLPAGFSRG